MKFTPGLLAGSLSGAAGNTVASHNRGGPYLRTRSIPTKSTTDPAQNAKTYLSQASSAWQSLTLASRLSWASWADSHPVTDRLGASRILTGHQAFVSILARLARAGAAPLIEPPVTGPPSALATLSLTYDVGAGDTQITFTDAPLAATQTLWLYGCVVSSPAINFIKNRERLFAVSTPAMGSPCPFSPPFEARFGIPEVGQVVHLRVHVFDTATGLLSQPLRTHSTVIST